jgi:hypothetical protein
MYPLGLLAASVIPDPLAVTLQRSPMFYFCSRCNQSSANRR